MTGDWGYLVIWEFRVKKGMESSFERAYGPDGPWIQLFRTGQSFVATELIRDTRIAGRYVTLDFWESHEVYEKFREANADRYKAIDAECEAMTESEVEIGRFARVGEPGQTVIS
jgi:heme-degrading monooxygenase HmoA